MCTPAPQMRDADTRHSVRPSMTSPRYNRTEVPWPPTIARPLPEQTLTTRPSIQAESPAGFQCLGLQLMWQYHAFIDTWNTAAAALTPDVARSVEHS
jgi:hypothetical protein